MRLVTLDRDFEKYKKDGLDRFLLRVAELACGSQRPGDFFEYDSIGRRAGR